MNSADAAATPQFLDRAGLDALIGLLRADAAVNEEKG